MASGVKVVKNFKVFEFDAVIAALTLTVEKALEVGVVVCTSLRQELVEDVVQ
jgi:hypothetical protein